MSVFLLILKILGIILLSLLGLILFLVFLILFCPFGYRAKGTLHREDHDVHGRVFWLFGLLALCVDSAVDSTDICFRICGIRKGFSRKDDNSRDFEDTSEESDSGIADRPLEAQEVKKETERKIPDPDPDVSSQEHFLKLRRLGRRIRDTFRSVKSLFSHLRETCQKITSLWENDSCREGIKTIVRKLFALLGELKPCKLKLALSFSTGSPDTTGELLGVLSMFPIGYRNCWQITPDFAAEEAYADGTFDIGGRLFGFQILRTAIGIVLDKNCRKLYNRLIR